MASSARWRKSSGISTRSSLYRRCPRSSKAGRKSAAAISTWRWRRVSQAMPASLSEYGEALTQRNALLKLLAERGGDSGQLDFWDETIARTGAPIILQRIEAVQEIEKLAARQHRS